MASSGRAPKWIDGSQEYITPKDAAQFLNCSLDAVYDSIKGGNIPGLKLNGQNSSYRIPTHSFLKWAKFSKDE